MLAQWILPALALSGSLQSVAAVPTRTNCRCTIVSNDTVPASTPRPSADSFDICSGLGPELEHFRHAEPDLYASYIHQAKASDSTPTDEEQPLTTTVLLQLAAKNGFQNLGVVLPSTESRIVCRSAPEPFSAYQDSRMTLLALQVIVAIAVLACLAECVTLVADWLSNRRCLQQKPALRLIGAEQRLRAVMSPESIFSPGAEKKLRAYSSPDWMPRTLSEKGRQFDAYEEEDDDEMNRPVM
ncbi:hypothetical protein BS50DRAFT_632078 [Corynespora cassiicola Philippines]|uniref:Ig-like domain-containing protein n=1 Tax=Corynespora cassiicola Philippines TaxID=1448308 RepID=A0A2T2NXL4_CORCC|nr:hypothetical protein BS50DRAFT_632078 [Corynespora cassiicola Philippines]